MAGLTLSEIREALADQIRSNVDRQVTVRAYPPGVDGPSVLIELASDPGSWFTTFGPQGLASINFDVTVDPGGADIESPARRLDDFLSVGSGNGSSVIDAICTDRTLGLVGCSVNVTGVSVDRDAITATIAVEVMVNKIGARA